MNIFLQRVDQAAGFLCRWTLYLALTLTFLILSINVGLRYAAGTSLTWAAELPELMFPWMIMAGVVLAAQHGSHIAVVILTQRLGASRRWVLAAGSLLVAALYLALAWTTWPLFEVAADERTPILEVPGSVSVGCLMLGFVLLSIVTLVRLPLIWSGPKALADNAEGAAA